MCHHASGILRLILALTTGPAGDSPGGTIGGESPRERYESILDDYEGAQRDLLRTLQRARSDDERRKVAEVGPDAGPCAARLLALALAAPADPVAPEALAWVVRNRPSLPEGRQAAAILARDHLPSRLLGPICRSLEDCGWDSEPILRAILAGSPHREVRGHACYSLARALKNRANRGVDAPAASRAADEMLALASERYGDVAVRGKPLAELVEVERFELDNLAPGKTAPEFRGVDTGGRPMRLSDSRGKVVVLVFWGTWCGPCMQMVPHERELAARLAGRPFALLGVNSDRDREEAGKSMAKEGMTWRSWWDGGDQAGPIASRWNVHSWPSVFVLDAQGVIRHRDLRGAALDVAVDALLEELDPHVGPAPRPPPLRDGVPPGPGPSR